MRKLTINWKQWYERDYLSMGKSTHEIATECECTQSTVHYNFSKLGLVLRSGGARKGQKQNKEWIEKRTKATWDITPEVRRLRCSKMSKANQGRKQTEQHRMNISKAKRGAKSSSWKGGISPLSELVRKSFKSRQWRYDVFTRDRFTCQGCDVRGGSLQAHHIGPFSVIFEENKITSLAQALKCEEFWDINNGVTLCVACHDKYRKRIA